MPMALCEPKSREITLQLHVNISSFMVFQDSCQIFRELLVNISTIYKIFNRHSSAPWDDDYGLERPVYGMCAHISAEYCTCSFQNCIAESKSSSHHFIFFYFPFNPFLITPHLQTQNVKTQGSSLVSVCPTSKTLQDKHRKVIETRIVRGINVST